MEKGVAITFLVNHSQTNESGKQERFIKGKTYTLRADAASHHVRRQRAMNKDDYVEFMAERKAAEAEADGDADPDGGDGGDNQKTSGGDNNTSDPAAGNAGGSKASAKG